MANDIATLVLIVILWIAIVITNRRIDKLSKIMIDYFQDMIETLKDVNNKKEL